MKHARILLVAAFVMAMMALAVSGAYAAPTSPVTANVTAKIISCYVTTGTIDFGMQSMGANAESGAFSVGNDGNVPEHFWISSSDANNGVSGPGAGIWTIGSTPAADVFGLVLHTTGTIVSGTNQQYTISPLAPGNTYGGEMLHLWTPTSSTQTGNYQFTVTFTATE
jgi:hypothetical protein